MIFKTVRSTLNISGISMISQNTRIIRSNIRDSEVIEADCQDIHSILNRSAMINSMTNIEIINLEIFFRIIRIIRMTQTRLILILILFIQNSHQVRMILTEFRDLFSIQIKTSTTIHLDLIHSRTLHSRMTLHHRFVSIELRNLRNFRLDRMNSIEETTNIRARFIMRK